MSPLPQHNMHLTKQGPGIVCVLHLSTQSDPILQKRKEAQRGPGTSRRPHSQSVGLCLPLGPHVSPDMQGLVYLCECLLWSGPLCSSEALGE